MVIINLKVSNKQLITEKKFELYGIQGFYSVLTHLSYHKMHSACNFVHKNSKLKKIFLRGKGGGVQNLFLPITICFTI